MESKTYLLIFDDECYVEDILTEDLLKFIEREYGSLFQDYPNRHLDVYEYKGKYLTSYKYDTRVSLVEVKDNE